jgi:hypothetical protein
VAFGIEPGHGARDYLIDVSNGNSRPLTPEGFVGRLLSPDGRLVAVVGPDGTRGFWPLDGGGFHAIPGVDRKYGVVGWTPDGTAVYVVANRLGEKTVKLSRVNITTGKMDFWKALGDGLPTGATAGGPLFSADGNAYAYDYDQTLSEAYVVRGLK